MATDAARARAESRTAVVWEQLRVAIGELGGEPLRVLDAGGGSGGFAVPLAEHGHRVTVVDPSPDSLAALERRAAEAGVGDRVRALQGDAAGLPGVVGGAGFDLALCHSVLEVVDEPAEALRAVSAAVRPAGMVSILTANRTAAVLSRAGAGRLAEARRLLGAADGSTGAGDPVRRRLDVAGLRGLLATAGLTERALHGVRIFADLVPAQALDGDGQAAADLLALERAASEQPEFLAAAAQLHVLAVRR